jgi:hypothetical protein
VDNNGFANKTPYRHSFQELYINHSKNAIEILENLGLYEYDFETNEFTATVDDLRATKHYPRAVAAEGKISPCNGRLFLATLSSQNLKYVTGYLASRYLAKYVASIDEHNKIYFNSNGQRSNVVTVQYEALKNTKITSNFINEKKSDRDRRNKNNPRGRAISIMEMLCVILGFDQVFTDINFFHVSTLPKEERPGIQIKAEKISVDRNPDLQTGQFLPIVKVRNIVKQFPVWRKISMSESSIVIDQMTSGVSADCTTIFGLRPPELRFVQNQKQYYQWFYRDPKVHYKQSSPTVIDQIEKHLHHELKKSCWIDALGHRVFVRPAALKQICEYVETTRNIDYYPLDYNDVDNIHILQRENPKSRTRLFFNYLHRNYIT